MVAPSLAREGGISRRMGEASEEREVSLYDLALLVRKRWRLIAISVTVTTVVALAVALFSEPIYQAQAVVAPQSIETGSQSALGSLGGSLGGLASLAGIGGGEGGSTEQNLAILRSRILADRFIAKYDLRRDLFPDDWSETTDGWKAPGLFDRLHQSLSDMINPDSEAAVSPDGGPSPDETWRKFDEARSVVLDKESGLVTVSLESRSARQAASWTKNYIREANDYIRTKEIAEAGARLAYLSNQASTTTVAEVRDAIAKLMESELKRSMLANVREEFAFKIIDPPVAPELRAWPKRGLLVVVGVMGGLMLGFFLILVSSYIQVMRDARKG